MGGCCCCASGGSQLHTAPGFYYYPRTLDERVPLAANHGTGSTISTGLLVDTNLDTSIPDAYIPPPTPMPFDAPLGDPSGTMETCQDKNYRALQTTNSGPMQGVAVDSQETSDKCEDSKESVGKGHTKLEIDFGEELEVELSKSIEPLIPSAEEEDICPICLEEYDLENPRLLTQCEHHFHLACILEWMERSEVCPVCDKEVVIVPPID